MQSISSLADILLVWSNKWQKYTSEVLTKATRMEEESLSWKQAGGNGALVDDANRAHAVYQ